MNDRTLERAAALLPDAVAEFRRDVARATIGDLHATARRIRDDLATLQQYQERAYREDVTAILHDLNYSLETGSGRAVIYFDPMAESQWAEELMMLGAVIQSRLPRKYSAILASVRLDLKRCVLWFDLPAEPADDIPYEAAA